MAKRKTPTKDLRRRAEKQVGSKDDATMSRMVHELEVHQLQLEVQNEELRLARRNTESALERYAEVFEFAPIGYVTTERNGTITEINRVGARLLGGTPSQFTGKRFQAFVAPGGLRAFDSLVASVLAKSSASCELDLQTDSDRVPVRMTMAALRRVEPTLLIAFEDVSERRVKEVELADSEGSLRVLNERKDAFLAMLSHELRNPLSPIRTSVAVLQLAEPGSEAAKSAIGIIDRATAHLTRLVDDLLDITRITRGIVQLRREPVELIALLERTIEDLREGFKNQRIQLEARFEETELWMYADAARLVQSFSNVLTNAQKFTPRGGKVTITVKFVAPRAVIRIADNGVGIAAEVLDTLFEPFAQAPQSFDRGAGGLGLGLALVKSLIASHGGEVTIDSGGPGKGTDVVIALPAQRQHIETAPVHAWRAGERRRVLIIEDMVDTAQSLLNALVLMGHDVRVAHSGQAGIELIESFQPDVVLCDLGLPDMDGFALARRVRDDARLNPAYMVALSGYARPGDISRAFEAGFQRHLAKPPQLDELDALIGSVPERHRAPKRSTRR